MNMQFQCTKGANVHHISCEMDIRQKLSCLEPLFFRLPKCNYICVCNVDTNVICRQYISNFVDKIIFLWKEKLQVETLCQDSGLDY